MAYMRCERRYRSSELEKKTYKTSQLRLSNCACEAYKLDCKYLQLIIEIFVPHVNYASFSQWKFMSLHLRSSKYWPVIKIPARSCYRLVNENNITNTIKNFFTPSIFHVFCDLFVWQKGIFCIRRKKVLANRLCKFAKIHVMKYQNIS